MLLLNEAMTSSSRKGHAWATFVVWCHQTRKWSLLDEVVGKRRYHSILTWPRVATKAKWIMVLLYLLMGHSNDGVHRWAAVGVCRKIVRSHDGTR